MCGGRAACGRIVNGSIELALGRLLIRAGRIHHAAPTFPASITRQIICSRVAHMMRWIDPAELKNYETVPKLLEVYASAMSGEKVD